MCAARPCGPDSGNPPRQTPEPLSVGPLGGHWECPYDLVVTTPNNARRAARGLGVSTTEMAQKAKFRTETVSVIHGEGRRGDAAAARSSLSAPRMTIRSASSGSGRCSALASSHGARIHTSRSSSVVSITGMAFGWIGSTTAFGEVVRKPGRLRARNPAPHSGRRRRRLVGINHHALMRPEARGGRIPLANLSGQ